MVLTMDAEQTRNVIISSCLAGAVVIGMFFFIALCAFSVCCSKNSKERNSNVKAITSITDACTGLCIVSSIMSQFHTGRNNKDSNCDEQFRNGYWLGRMR